MSNLRTLPPPDPIIRCALAAAAVQDRFLAQRVAELAPYEMAARRDLITRDGYPPSKATQAVLATRWRSDS